jgi:hypothetical protein
MAESSRRRARGTITAVVAGWVALGFLASCGGKTNSAGAPVGQTTTSTSASGEVRLGCGTYCQSAGGGGGGAAGGQPAVTVVSSGTVTLDADGYVPVTLTCNVSVQCKGALRLVLESVNDPLARGQSDLLVDAGATRTLGVGLPSESVAFIRSHGPTRMLVFADSGESQGLGADVNPNTEASLRVAPPAQG